MVLDSSAVLAILLLEPEAKAFAEAIAGSSRRLISTGTLLELNIVATTLSHRLGTAVVDEFMRDAQIVAVPFDEEQLAIACEAYQRYGRRQHRARLNFGDCFAYALAKASNEALLYKGDDFARTDVITWRPARG